MCWLETKLNMYIKVHKIWKLISALSEHKQTIE